MSPAHGRDSPRPCAFSIALFHPSILSRVPQGPSPQKNGWWPWAPSRPSILGTPQEVSLESLLLPGESPATSGTDGVSPSPFTMTFTPHLAPVPVSISTFYVYV